MILLVSGATATIRRLPPAAPVGHLLTPRGWNHVGTLAATGRELAADNDCFQRLDPAAYVAMLLALAAVRDRVAWVTLPDVVGDAWRTRRRWRHWRPLVRRLGLRAAYVAQDGSEGLPPPWPELDALFVGGTTAWKEGAAAAALMREARARGKWVHVGRVNTLRRLRLISELADSIDGSMFSRFPDRWIPWILPHLNIVHHRLPEAA